MPPKPAAVSLSASESTLFCAFVKNLNSLDADWEQIAGEAGYKNASNARTMFKRFRDKMLKSSGAEPANAAQPKRKMDKVDGDDAAEQPKKRSKPTKTTKPIKKEKQEAEDDEDGEDSADKKVFYPDTDDADIL